MFPEADENAIGRDYARAKESYARFGVDTDEAVARLGQVPLSLHCWQGDDLTGFEVHEGPLDSGGLLATGSQPGRPRNADELRCDLDKAISLIPGPMRVNLHAIYAETGGEVVERNQLGPERFSRWMDWACERGYGLDFNPTFFAHPMANSGYTLASPDKAIRDYWIEHGIGSRRIAAAMAAAVGAPAGNNLWIPDGDKDHPMDRWAPRGRLVESLDTIFAAEVKGEALDSVEGKLFGIGSEDYVVGSHEFYFGYCLRSGKTLCLDMGHFHPTETIADKLSACLTFLDGLLLHVSRGVRWDSDHVVILSDDVREVCHEVVRGGALDRVRFALDFFDAGVNRIAAWVTGSRAFKALLLNAMLEPTGLLRELEANGDRGAKLALLQDLKLMPLGAVWNHFCLTHASPPATAWLNEVARYENEVLAKR